MQRYYGNKKYKVSLKKLLLFKKKDEQEKHFLFIHYSLTFIL